MNDCSVVAPLAVSVRWLDLNGARWPSRWMRRTPATAPDWNAETLRDFAPGKRYLIGVSGGRDSVALLHWLLEGGYRKLVVCHLDHRLRGRSSAADARFVERLANANGLPFETSRVDVRKLAAETKQSIEAAARRARYAFFAEIARRRRCRTVVLGHHADDLVETYLINLFRGAGMQGQRGIRPVSTQQIGSVELNVVRPLLSVSRGEIDEYVVTHRLRFREDASNEQLDALRNRVRHRVIPMLEKEFGRDIRKSVRRAASIASEEDALLSEMLPEISTNLLVKQVRALSIALQRRTVMRWLRANAVADVGFDLVEQIRAMLDTASGPAKINLPGDRHARRRSGQLFVEG